MLLPEILPGWDTRPPARSGRSRPPWTALTEAVAELMDGMWCGKQRLFVRHFALHAGALLVAARCGCRPSSGIDRAVQTVEAPFIQALFRLSAGNSEIRTACGP